MFFLITNRSDYENTLRIILRFLEKPRELLEFCRAKMEKYEVIIPNNEMDMKYLDNIILDKKGKKLEKVLK